MAATREETTAAASTAHEHHTTDPDAADSSDSDEADATPGRRLSGRVVVYVYETDGVVDDGGKERYLFVKTKYRKSSESTETSASKTGNALFGFHAAFTLKDDDKDDVIEFEVIADKTLGNSTLGVASINLSELDADAVSTGSVWLPLGSRPGKEDPAVGRVRVKVALSLVKLTIVEARGLKAVSSNSANPYAFARYNKTKYRAPVVKKSLDPSWEESAQLLEAATWTLPFRLGLHFFKLEMWSKGLLGSSFLGQARLRLADYVVGEGAAAHDVWVPLLPREADEEVSGSVRLRIEALEPPEDLILKARTVPADTLLASGSTVQSAMDAAPDATRAKLFVGQQFEVEMVSLAHVSDEAKTDPYVELRYGETRWQTQIARRQTSPEFNERHTWSFTKLTKKMPEHAVIGDVWDKHRLSDTFLGRFRIELGPVPLDGGWHTVSEFELKGRRERLVAGQEPDVVQGTATVRARVVRVIVDVLRASGLAAKDRNGRSDPYVIASYGESQSYRTETVKKTLDPVWNTPLSFAYEVGSELITFDVWDQDTMRDDYLGHVVLRIGDYADGRPHKAWYTLARRDLDDPVSGELCLQIQCVGMPAHTYNAPPVPSV